MKTKLLILSSLFLVSFYSCKKDQKDSEVETTFQLSENEAVGDYLTDDVNNVFFEVSTNAGLMGRTNQQIQTLNNLTCAAVNITPAGSFPKTIVIDFGTGCTANGITRSGKINIVLSDTVRKSGSTAVMTFDNYIAQGFKVEGTMTWTNTSTQSSIGWQRKIENGKITGPNAYYWLHVGTKNVTQTAGFATPLNLLDDVFSVTGTHTVTNALGKSRTATILEALEVKTICGNVTKGTVKFEGPNHFAILNYGDGSCDRVATISIDGHATHTILLP